MADITMTIDELESLLNEHKRVMAEYLTRNLSCYHWWGKDGVDSEKAREELKKEALNSRYPDEFNVLKKYLRG